MVYSQEFEAAKNNLDPCGKAYKHFGMCTWRGYKSTNTKLWSSLVAIINGDVNDGVIQKEHVPAATVLLAGGLVRNLEYISGMSGLPLADVELYARRYVENRIWLDNFVVQHISNPVPGQEDVGLSIGVLVGEGKIRFTGIDENGQPTYASNIVDPSV